MSLWTRIGNDSNTVFADENIIDYSKINYRWLCEYIQRFKSLGIHDDSNIAVCVNDDSIIMPLILSMYNFENTLKFMNFRSIKNLVLENYFDCDFCITDFECHFKTNVSKTTEFSFYGKKLYIYQFYCYHHPNTDVPKKRYVYYTSGTSGIPKEIYKSESAVEGEARCLINEMGIHEGDVILCMAPCSHVYAQSIACWTAALAKAKVKYLPANILPTQLLDEIENTHCDILLSTPFFYNEIYEQLMRRQDKFKLLLCAGAFPSENVLNSNLKINYVYGTTETGVISIQTYKSGYKKTSVGQPIEGVKILMGNEIYTDTIKMYQFSVNSPYMAYKSIQNGEEKEFQDSINLSDYGYIDTDGEVFLKGRIDNIININGEKVSSTEIELVLSKIPGVKEVKVIKAHNDNGEYPAAYIVPNNEYKHNIDVLERNIKIYFLENSELYKLPKEFIFINEFKRTPTGKILLKQ